MWNYGILQLWRFFDCNSFETKPIFFIKITNALMIILARPLSFSLVAPWPPLLALRWLPRARNATDLLSQPILPTYVTHRPANTLPAHFSTPSEKSWELFQKVGWAGKGVVGLATIYVGGTLESPRWLDPLCLGRSWPWAKILMKYLGPLWRRTL